MNKVRLYPGLFIRTFVQFSFFLTFVQGFSGLAAQSKLETLLQREDRPSIIESAGLRQAFEDEALTDRADLPKGKIRSLRPDLQFNYPFWFEQAKAKAASMIAHFEKGFPGATWIFIGRDMEVVASLFECFYEKLGQSNRVIRIGMSQPTLDSAKSHDDLLDLLRSEGVPIDTLTNSPHPFVLADAISSHGGRQISALFNAVYEFHSKRGVPAALLARRFNRIGFRVHTTRMTLPDVAEAQVNLPMIEAKLFQTLPDRNFSQHLQMWGFDDQRTQAVEGLNEIGYEHFTGAWHGSFGALQRNGQRMQAVRGPPSDENLRRAILQFQYKLSTHFYRKAFVDEVREVAHGMGFEIPDKRPELSPHLVEQQIASLSLPDLTLREFLLKVAQFDKAFRQAYLGYLEPALADHFQRMLASAKSDDLDDFLKLNRWSQARFDYFIISILSRASSLEILFQTYDDLKKKTSREISGEAWISFLASRASLFLSTDDLSIDPTTVSNLMRSAGSLHQTTQRRLYRLYLSQSKSQVDFLERSDRLLNTHPTDSSLTILDDFSHEIPNPNALERKQIEEMVVSLLDFYDGLPTAWNSMQGRMRLLNRFDSKNPLFAETFKKLVIMAQSGSDLHEVIRGLRFRDRWSFASTTLSRFDELGVSHWRFAFSMLSNRLSKRFLSKVQCLEALSKIP